MYVSSAVGLMTFSPPKRSRRFGQDGGVAQQPVVGGVLVAVEAVRRHQRRRAQVGGQVARQSRRQAPPRRQRRRCPHPLFRRRQRLVAVEPLDQHALAPGEDRCRLEAVEQRRQEGAGQQRLPLLVHGGVAEDQSPPRSGDDAVEEQHLVGHQIADAAHVEAGRL